MGRKIVEIATDRIAVLLTTCQTWGDKLAMHVAEGIPAGATVVGAYFDPAIAPKGVLRIVVEHPSWPATADGAAYPLLHVLYRLDPAAPKDERQMSLPDRAGQMYTITKEFAFEAAHHLEGLPDTHKCSKPHGHSYVVKVELQAPILNEVGFVVDYGDLAPLKQYIDTYLDHHDLNEVFTFQTSAENLARHLFEWCHERWPFTIAVHVSETAKTWASYYRGY